MEWMKPGRVDEDDVFDTEPRTTGCTETASIEAPAQEGNGET